MTDTSTGLDRRRFLALLSAAATAPGVLAAEEKKKGTVTTEMLSEAEKVAGLEFTGPERELMLNGLDEQLEDYKKIREFHLDNGVAPAVRFDPVPAGMELKGESAFRLSFVAVPNAGAEELPFLSVTQLGKLLRAGKVTSVGLTKMYLERLRKLDPVLHAVITYTEERAMEQAERADRELAAGKDRGPLHGIPWGAKDLLAAKGYRTTWGSVPFKEQVIDQDATVVERLEAAGAVLVAKLTLGELAWGDVWFDAMTRNPWNPEQGSSGSSAGSSAATAAGAVGFAIGSETLGSIVSPSTRTGCTGLRPTFGRVSRHGAMALSWSMDKLGPICRSVEDCAAVLQAIHGPDGKDLTVVDAPFRWDPNLDVKRLRVGYLKSLFEEKPEDSQKEWYDLNLAALEDLRKLGIELKPVELPKLPIDPLRVILSAEASAAFDELTRSGKDDLLVRQIEQAWPNSFRLGQTIPAVAYIQANRIRTLAMQEMARLFQDIDVYVSPTYGGDNLLLTNLTGHPCVVLPNGFRKDGTPTSITFLSNLFQEGNALALAKAYQDATGWHLKRPKLEGLAPTPAYPPKK
ncbi:MAG TPA: amidase [Thermoanaerobaculia bacterium]|jgi:Asp-tRNA(Asn)/Glu-tRNA(Gln) amidotransferase A subunit family amidase|nr:amidase [Thermoanaerobaculia bacterium]